MVGLGWERSRPGSWLVVAIVASACAGPPLELQASLENEIIDRGGALRGEVVLHNLTDADVEVSAPGLPEIALTVYRDGERVGGNTPYLLNEVWARTLLPDGSFTHMEGPLFRSVELPPGDYELLVELWTHQYGVLSAGSLEFAVR